MRAFIFPGQGSQSVGMGKALADASPAAREVFQEVDDALGQKLFQLMSEGPEDQLTLTENAQPAIMANAIATLRGLDKVGNKTANESYLIERVRAGAASSAACTSPGTWSIGVSCGTCGRSSGSSWPGASRGTFREPGRVSRRRSPGSARPGARPCWPIRGGIIFLLNG